MILMLFPLALTETDHTFPLPARRRAEDLLIEAKAQYHIQVFSGVAHGFALRGDPNIPDTRKSLTFSS